MLYEVITGETLTPQGGKDLIMRLAGMEQHRQPVPRGNIELGFKQLLLSLAIDILDKVIKTDLADGNNPAAACQLL